MKKLLFKVVLFLSTFMNAQWNHPDFKCGISLEDAQKTYKELFDTTITHFNKANGDTLFSMGAPTEGYIMTYSDNKLIKVEHYYQRFDEEMEEDYTEYESILICK